MKKYKISQILTGFTLIELLVVISIIGILVAFVSFNFTGTLKATRDTQRKNDLKTYQTAMEGQANKNDGYYMTRLYSTGVNIAASHCADFGMTSPCAADPLNSGDYIYRYKTNGSVGGNYDASSYTLWTALEDVGSSPTYWVVCSDGKSFQTTTNPSTYNGVCP